MAAIQAAAIQAAQGAIGYVKYFAGVAPFATRAVIALQRAELTKLVPGLVAFGEARADERNRLAYAVLRYGSAREFGARVLIVQQAMRARETFARR